MQTSRMFNLTPAGFETFWLNYPRKVAKGAALKAWLRVKPDAEQERTIADAIRWQRDQPQWRQNGGQFIPHPATWLNQRRWEDAKPLHQSGRAIAAQSVFLEAVRERLSTYNFIDSFSGVTVQTENATTRVIFPSEDAKRWALKHFGQQIAAAVAATDLGGGTIFAALEADAL